MDLSENGGDCECGGVDTLKQMVVGKTLSIIASGIIDVKSQSLRVVK